MHLALVGLNHKSAPIEVREGLAFPASLWPSHSSELRNRANLAEVLILTTCNRTEVYAVAARPEDGMAAIQSYLEQIAGQYLAKVGECRTHPGFLHKHFYRFWDMDVARHAFRVAAGLDSMILGEPQILGQLRAAFDVARGAQTTGVFLNQLFRHSIEVGKRVRATTSIGSGAASISQAAVELARKMFGELTDKRVLLVGAGKMGELAAKNLAAHGAATVYVANRTWERAREIAGTFHGQAVSFESLDDRLVECDVVISSTGAPHFVIDQKMVRRAMRARRGRALFFIDIAVPRDIDPAIHGLEGAFLYNIDDLHAVVQANLEQRAAEIGRVEAILDQELARFFDWLLERKVAPLIADFRQRAERIRRDEVERALRGQPGMDEKAKAAVEAVSAALVNKLLHGPTMMLKEWARSGKALGSAELDLAMRLFSGAVAEEVVSELGNGVRELGATREESETSTSFSLLRRRVGEGSAC